MRDNEIEMSGPHYILDLEPGQGESNIIDKRLSELEVQMGFLTEAAAGKNQDPRELLERAGDINLNIAAGKRYLGEHKRAEEILQDTSLLFPVNR